MLICAGEQLYRKTAQKPNVGAQMVALEFGYIECTVFDQRKYQDSVLYSSSSLKNNNAKKAIYFQSMQNLPLK